MKTVVVKAGGSGHLVETSAKPSIPWLDYRRINFDSSYLDDLVTGVGGATDAARIIFVPGGMGAYLYIELARHGHVPNNILADIGCAIVDVNGLIAAAALSAAGINVCPNQVEPGIELKRAISVYNVVVVRAAPKYRSSDALAAAAAAIVEADELVIFKRGVPLYHVGFEEPTVVRRFSVADLLQTADSFGERPGSNSILDRECLELISSNSIDTRLVESGLLRELALVLAHPDDPRLRQTHVEYKDAF